MNSKQKFGYTVLGAVIMVVGMGIGMIVSPNLTAKLDDGHFEHITCASLTVIDKDNKGAISLFSGDSVNAIYVYDKQEKVAVSLGSEDATNIVRVRNKQGEATIALGCNDVLGGSISILNQETAGILIASNEDRSAIEIYNPLQHHTGIKLGCGESRSKITVDGQAGEESILLVTDAKLKPLIAIIDRAGKIKSYLD